MSSPIISFGFTSGGGLEPTPPFTGGGFPTPIPGTPTVAGSGGGSSTFDKILQVINTGTGVFQQIQTERLLREQIRANQSGQIFVDPGTKQLTSNLGFGGAQTGVGLGLSGSSILLLVIVLAVVLLLRR